MRKNTKRFLKIGALVAGVFVLASCTKSFCSEKDIAHMLYREDSGVITTVNTETAEVEHKYNDVLDGIINNAWNAGLHVPTIEYFMAIDEKVLTFAIEQSGENYEISTITDLEKAAVLKDYGYLKFLGSKENRTTATVGKDLWANWELWNHELSNEHGYDFVPDRDFSNYYKENLYSRISANRACITVYDGEYGPEGEKSLITAKTWKYAFEKGVIEGLLVFPVAALVDFLAHSFAAFL